jgi:hypothetical protein
MNHVKLQKMFEFAHRNKLPLMMWGHTGIGKTTSVYEYAERIGAKVIPLYLSTQDQGDLIGLPGRVDNRTVWMKPEWLPAEDDPGKYIFFLDELNRAPRFVWQAMFPFILEGRLHTHVVPKDSWVIAAGNPQGTDDYDVTEMYDKALISRLCHVKLTPDIGEWLSRYDGKIDDSVHRVIAKEPAHLQFNTFDYGFTIQPDARAITRMATALKDMSHEEFESFGYEFVEGCVGTTLASMVIQERRNMLISIDPEDVLKRYSKIRDKVKSISEGEMMRNDVLGGANRKLISYLKGQKGDKKEIKLTEREWKNLAEYLKDIPRDACQAFLTMLINNQDMYDILKQLSTDKDLFKRVEEANMFDSSKKTK